MTLILTFALLMFIFRLAMDRLAPANVKLPNWANLAFGLPLGAAAGILTIGIFLIGAGFVQASNSIIGFRGWARRRAPRPLVDSSIRLYAAAGRAITLHIRSSEGSTDTHAENGDFHAIF